MLAEFIATAADAAVTPTTFEGSFKGAGLWPVNADRALARLRKGSRTQKYSKPTTDLPVMIESVPRAAQALGKRKVKKLERAGHTIASVRANTIMLSDMITHKQRTPQSRKRAGQTLGGLLTSVELREQEAAAAKAKKPSAAVPRAATTANESDKENVAPRPRGRPKGTTRGVGTNKPCGGHSGRPGRGQGREGRGSGASRGASSTPRSKFTSDTSDNDQSPGVTVDSE